ncbi:MAG: diaminopimelate epimerase [Synergistaceae bacterium]|nr:diaminopimelate epimerase [Synergistaceae bacterium]
MPFTKVHGNGNDFVVIENLDRRFAADDLSRIARALCHRKTGIGADGILVVEPSEKADLTMRIFNSDGSEGEMCGNGARCFARYAFETKLAGPVLDFETLAGTMHAEVKAPDVVLDMGTIDCSRGLFDETVSLLGETFPLAALRVGVPHCAVFMEDLAVRSRNDLVLLGRTLRHDSLRFPQGVNVNFVQNLGEGKLLVTTYERGVEDLTDSCGTGSTMSAIAAAKRWGLSSPVRVLNPGGVNTVHLEWEEDGRSCRVRLEGRTAMVARGTVLEEAGL